MLPDHVRLAAGIFALLVATFLTSGFVRWHCVRCADQRTTFDVLTISVAVPEPHYDEFGLVELWERAHGKPCPNLWRRGSFEPRWQNNPSFPSLHFEAATVQDRVAAEKLMLTVPPESLNQQDVLGRTAMHWTRTV